MVNPIQHKTAVKIISCIKTNSVPFKVTCENDEVVIVKSMFKKEPPYPDLINEILCNYLLESWGIHTAVPCIVKIPQYVFNDFLLQNPWRDSRYNTFDFDKALFYGVIYFTATELELYNSVIKNKVDYKRYSNPTDLIKIATFDRWIGNNDRRAKNPNILLRGNDEKIDFVAIDHTQAFGNQDVYKSLKIALMNSPQNNSILDTPMSKSIITFAGSKILGNFDKEVLNNIETALEKIDDILEQVPSEFGLSKHGKRKIKEILSDNNRNIIISKYNTQK